MQDSLLDKQAAFQVAQTNLAVAQAKYDSFMAAKPWVTNSTYAETVARLNDCINRRNGLAQSVGIMKQDYNSQVINSYTYNNGPKRNVVLATRDGANASRQAEMAVDQVTIQYDRQEVTNLDLQIPPMLAQVKGMLQAIKKFQDDKLQQAKSDLDNATSDVSSAQQEIKRLTDQLSMD